MLVWSQGSVKSAFDYWSFGKRLALTMASEKVTEEFTGKELDEETGLNYFGARYYDSEVGAWVTVDPMRQHFSGYLYGSNNPINRVDEDGMQDALLAQTIMKGGNPFSVFGSALSQNVVSTVKNSPELVSNSFADKPESNMFLAALVLAPLVIPVAEATAVVLPTTVRLSKEFIKYRPGLETKIVETTSKVADVMSIDPQTAHGSVAIATFLSNFINNIIVPIFKDDNKGTNSNAK